MRSIFILLTLLCMIAPTAALSAVDDAGGASSSGDSATRPYSFDRADEPQFSDSKQWDKPVTLEINNMGLGEVVQQLLKDTDAKFSIDPQVKTLSVHATLKNVPLRSALLEVVRAAGATVTSRGDGVLYIAPAQPYSSMAVELQRKIAEMMAELARERTSKSEDHPSVKALQNAIEALQKRLGQEWEDVPHMGLPGAPTWYFANPSASGKGGKTRIFVTRFINPAELVPLIYALGARQVTVVSGGKLVVNGTEEILAEANDLIAKLDTEEALPRPVTVEVTAEYCVTDDTGKKEELRSVTVGTVPEGEPIRLQTFAEPKNDNVVPYLLLDIQLVPEVGAGDQITLTGQVSLPALAETPQIKMGEMPVAVSVKSGSEIVIAQAAYDVDGGKLEYVVTARVKVGKERLKTRTKAGFGGGGMGGYGGLGGFGGDFSGGDMTQWKDACDDYGQNMTQLGAAMEAAAAQWQRAFDAFGGGGGMGGFGGGMGGFSGGMPGSMGGGGGGSQDGDKPNCSSGGGGGA